MKRARELNTATENTRKKPQLASILATLKSINAGSNTINAATKSDKKTKNSNVLITKLKDIRQFEKMKVFFQDFLIAIDNPLPDNFDTEEKKQNTYFLAQDKLYKDKIIGFVWLQQQIIQVIAVMDEYRRQGIGRDLIETCKIYLAKRQHFVMSTSPNMNSMPNITSIGFWEKLNFKQSRDFQKYFTIINDNSKQRLPEGIKIKIEIHLGSFRKNAIDAVINSDGIYFAPIVLIDQDLAKPALMLYYQRNLKLIMKNLNQGFITTEFEAYKINSIPKTEATISMITEILDSLTPPKLHRQ